MFLAMEKLETFIDPISDKTDLKLFCVGRYSKWSWWFSEWARVGHIEITNNIILNIGLGLSIGEV